MINRRNTALLATLLFSCLSVVNLNAAEQPVTPDVRLLIDISGSMKKNDPNNLRIPALQMVTNLLPKGAKAGVWAFGRYVNMLVPLAQVDTAWQQKATVIAKKINSAGLYTNIGDVLEKASYGWNNVNSREKRSIILLTDGMVDISKDAKVNQRERERILQSVLPKLQQANVAIHTIALSQNADHDLLRKLSTLTDGWYQAVDSADELQKVFLKIFEQAAARDSLPLDNNTFKVDTSVEEMTLLVFKKDGKKTTKLFDPDQQEINLTSANKSGDKSIRWFASDTYDLITVDRPQVGDWKIDADIDPDNRVMVVSKLGLSVADVPNNLLAGESIDYQLSLLEDGEKIVKSDFLQLVKAQLIQSKEGQTNRLAMFYDNANSQFKQSFFTDANPGVLNLKLEVRSPTFERTRNHAINIYGSPLIDEVVISNNMAQAHLLKLSVREDLVENESLTISVTVTNPDQEKQYLVVEDMSEAIEIKALAQGGEYSIVLDIKGKTKLGRDFSVTPDTINFTAPVTAGFVAANIETPEAATENEIEQPKVETESPVAETNADSEVAESSVTDTKDETDDEWSLWFYLGIGINVFFAIGGFLVWRFIKKRNQQNAKSVSAELGIEEEEEELATSTIERAGDKA